ncbi:MAG: hypothetical protein MZV64_65090 [Ignavibacteriales bacterium]|nr:hypothetical protein [Ignavibacteriales bacterium]
MLGFVDEERHRGDFVVAGKKVLGNYDDLARISENIESLMNLIIAN